MIDREKVIRGLEMCTQPAPSSCRQCPYKETPDNYPHCVHHGLQMDALALLKEQEMPLPEPPGNEPDGYRIGGVIEVTDDMLEEGGGGDA